ncbi:MAG: ferritin family protein [Planctomycetes bacterium]|jgi:bacterioferritin (cytochrome b1)|nr:ferritin family protein [Planctomycetota bacterium]
MSTRLDLSKLSLMDALDLAKLIEMEACHRYQMFANQFGHSSGNDAGAFFAMMAKNEAKHGQDLEARRDELFGDKPAKVTLDDLYDVEAPDMGAPHRGMSILEAFNVGLAAEQKAYDFYDSALPGIKDKDVRELFIELRDEEVEHVQMLKDAMAKLPESASEEVEYDLDETPYL